jgi:hypothetical protein
VPATVTLASYEGPELRRLRTVVAAGSTAAPLDRRLDSGPERRRDHERRTGLGGTRRIVNLDYGADAQGGVRAERRASLRDHAECVGGVQRHLRQIDTFVEQGQHGA